MGRSFNMTLRDEEIEVEIDDYSVDPDTNGSSLEYTITSEEHKNWDLTDKEEELIEEKCWEVIADFDNDEADYMYESSRDE